MQRRDVLAGVGVMSLLAGCNDLIQPIDDTESTGNGNVTENGMPEDSDENSTDSNESNQPENSDSDSESEDSTTVEQSEPDSEEVDSQDNIEADSDDNDGNGTDDSDDRSQDSESDDTKNTSEKRSDDNGTDDDSSENGSNDDGNDDNGTDDGNDELDPNDYENEVRNDSSLQVNRFTVSNCTGAIDLANVNENGRVQFDYEFFAYRGEEIIGRSGVQGGGLGVVDERALGFKSDIDNCEGATHYVAEITNFEVFDNHGTIQGSLETGPNVGSGEGISVQSHELDLDEKVLTVHLVSTEDVAHVDVSVSALIQGGYINPESVSTVVSVGPGETETVTMEIESEPAGVTNYDLTVEQVE